MAVRDVLLDDAGDLRIENGDFVIGESDEQHLMLLVNLAAGSLKQFPLTGVGIMQYSGSSDAAGELRKYIKINAEGDGYSNIVVNTNQDSNGEYKYFISADRT